MNTQQNNLLRKNDVITALKNIGMIVPSDITESLNDSDYVTYDTLSLIIRTTAQYNNQDFNKLYELTVKKIKELYNNERAVILHKDTIVVAGNLGAVNDSTLLSTNENYEHVNHPSHYNNYSKEVIDMMESIWGTDNLITFCEMNAFKYRMRMGTKPENSIEQDIQKEQWYLNKAKELKQKLKTL